MRTVAFGNRRVIQRCRVRRCAASRQGTAIRLGQSPGRIGVRRRPAEVSGMSRLRDRYPLAALRFRANIHWRMVAAARLYELIC